MKKVYIIMNEQWTDGESDEDYILFGSRVYLSEAKAKNKCKELNEKFQKAIEGSSSKLHRIFRTEYRFLDEEESE